MIFRNLFLLAATLPATSVGASTLRPRGGTSLIGPKRRHAHAHVNAHAVEKAAVTIPTDGKAHAVLLSDPRGGDAGATTLPSNPDTPKVNELAGAAFFTSLQILLNQLFRARSVPFPAMLGCTILVFASLVATELLLPGVGDTAFLMLQPGANLLTKWLPVMFVPGLAMLPLAPAIGSAADVAKVLVMIVLGFGFTMASTGYLVLALRTSQGLVEKEPAVAAVANEKPARGGRGRGNAKTAVANPPPAAAPSKPFSEQTLRFLVRGTILTGAVSILATRRGCPHATPLRTVFMFFGTVLTYVFGARLPPSFTKVVHPLVTSTAGTLLLTDLDAKLTGSTFRDVLRSYKAGSLSPSRAGAGDILLFLLGPAVGCLSIAMYSRKQIMKENLPVVVSAMLCSSLGGLFGTAWFVRLLNIASSKVIRLSLLSRNVTTALAIVITQILGGDMAIAASVVVLTGIFGATVGRGLLDALNIKDPVSRGLGMGAAGQGLGVAAMMPEKEAFPFAAINMVLTAVCATALVSVPSVKEALVNIVSGGLE
ncbi:hypothetical protein ACHAXS_013913 [Conticribra weissflogii]